MRRHAKLLVGILTLLASLGAASALADAPPTVTIAAPSEVKYNSAHFSGTVDPDGGPSSTLWHFEYREASLPEEESSWTQLSFDQEIPAESEGVETGETPVADNVSGLEAGTEYLVRLIAANEEGGNRVVSASKAFTTDGVSPPEARQVEVSGVTSSSAHLEGIVNSGGSGEGEAAGSYRFECQPACPSAEASHEFAAEGFADGADHPVQADATELQPSLEYTVKLIARNAQTDAAGSPVEAEANFETGAIAPTVATGTNTPEGQGKVLVRGYVNPRNDQVTECEFLYGLTTAYGQSAPCEGDPGAAGKGVEVTAKLTGLEAGKTFHFALRASNSAGSEESEDGVFATLTAPEPEGSCPNEAIREEQHSTGLPDCRAWEMVSPFDKNGGDIGSDTSRTRSSLNGDAVDFVSASGFAEPSGAGIATDYIAERTGTAGTQGWSTHSLSPLRDPLTKRAALLGKDTKYWQFSDDLSRAVLQSSTPLVAEPNVQGVLNLYLRQDALDPGPGSYQLLTGCPSPPDGPCSSPLSDPRGFTYLPKVADATPDLGQIIFEAPRDLSNDAPPYPPFPGSLCNNNPFVPYVCDDRLYETDHGLTRYVGFIPTAPDIECGPTPLDPCEGAPRSIAGAGATQLRYTPDTISDDGSRVFFTVPDEFRGLQGAVYMREDHATSVQLNASERTDCAEADPCSGTPAPDPSGPQPAGFQTATPDGSRAFFESAEQLTDTPGGGIYMYDTTKPASDPHNLTLVGPRGFAVLATSDDGSYVYFYAQGAIIPGQPPLADGAPFGIYLWHQGTLKFIGSLEEATTATGDNALGPRTIWGTEAYSARTTPDGKSLLFMSNSGIGLTGYDQTTDCLVNHAGEYGCLEAYLYRAADDSLTCVSCNPSGAPAIASSTYVVRGIGTSASGPATYPNHPISADGSHVFFESGEALLPEDTNGRTDVYSYEVADGSLHLISGGSNPSDSHFLDASPDGKNAFFTTYERLSRWDSDQSSDLYDARVGGGFAEPAVTTACAGEACLTGPAGVAPRAAASHLTGPGNRPRCRPRHHHRCHQRHRHHHHRAAGNHLGGNR